MVTKVTILILIDGFLQFKISDYNDRRNKSHNPYFNRWFSAIRVHKKVKLNPIMSQSLF